MKVVLLIASVCSLMACGASYREVTPSDGVETFPTRLMPIDGSREPDEVRVAVARALADRNYLINDEAETAMVATLNHRRLTLQVQVVYSPVQIGIEYVAGSGLLINEQGRSPQYDKLTRALEQQIRKRLKKAPPITESEPLIDIDVRIGDEAPSGPGTIPPPSVALFRGPQSVESARQATRRGMAEHRWVIEEDRGTTLIARLDHRGEQVRVRIDLDARAANVSYVDSVGLEFDAMGRNGAYERWLRNLVTAIEEASN